MRALCDSSRRQECVGRAGPVAGARCIQQRSETEVSERAGVEEGGAPSTHHDQLLLHNTMYPSLLFFPG